MRRFYSDFTFAFNSFGRPFCSWMLELTLSNKKSPFLERFEIGEKGGENV
jgi:hypothetical protein